jgi:hypothetical protein
VSEWLRTNIVVRGAQQVAHGVLLDHLHTHTHTHASRKRVSECVNGSERVNHSEYGDATKAVSE